MVQNGYGYQNALRALGLEGNSLGMWERFAGATGRTCEGCVFGRHGHVDEMMEAAALTDLRGHCERWRDEEAGTCEGFIGADDPVVIPIKYDLRGRLDALKVAYEDGEFAYMDDVARYMVAFQNAAKLKAKREAAAAEKQSRKHIEDIGAFVEWQLEQPDAVLHHFQAHGCAKCANGRPEQIEEGLPGCRFAVEGLTHKRGWGDGDYRAPEFGVLVTAEGWMLPRCEMFVYRETPVLHGVMVASKTGVALGKDRKRVVEWLHGLAAGASGYYSDRNVMWGILRWLDYGRPVETATDWERLKRFIVREWDELGGDEAVGTLLDVALSERRCRESRSMPLRLANGVTGEVEEFAALDFEYVQGKKPAEWWIREWPEGWPRVWESDTDSDTDCTD